MTFKEFCKTHKLGWYRVEELPEDVKKDLSELLENDDKHIGFTIYQSHITDDNGNIHFQGMKIGYYWRTIKPMTNLEPWNWFWRIKRFN